MKKKNYLIISGIIFIVIIIGVIIWYSISVESKKLIIKKVLYYVYLRVNVYIVILINQSLKKYLMIIILRYIILMLINLVMMIIKNLKINLVLMVELLQQYSLKMVKKKLLLLELKEIYP